jgi:hypothetical protein
VWIVTAFILSTTAVQAGDEVLTNFFGNTAISKGGRADTYTHFRADHTFDLKVPAYGMTFVGTWEIEGEKVCRTFDVPPPGISNPVCTPAESRSIGDNWTVTNNGQELTVTLVKGVVDSQ